MKFGDTLFFRQSQLMLGGKDHKKMLCLGNHASLRFTIQKMRRSRTKIEQKCGESWRPYLGIRCCPFYGRKICETVINLPLTKVGPDKPMISQATVSFSQAVHNPSHRHGKQQPLTFPQAPSWHSEAAGETCSLSRTSGWKNWGWKQVMQ
jgi:hypothetical protein